MSIYTYWGNKDEHTNGTSVLKIASGYIDVGQSGDFTTAEYNYFSPEYILRPGVVPWARNDFPWVREDALVHVFGGGGGGGAATVPGTPTGVSGSADNASVLVSWTAPASNGGATITGYRVTPYIAGTAQASINTGSSATNYNVTGLTNGTAYTFKVAAINSVGTGADSISSSAITPATTQTTLFADSNLSGIAGSGDASTVSIGTVFYIGPSGASVTRRALGVRLYTIDPAFSNYLSGSSALYGELWGGGPASPASMTLLASKIFSPDSALQSGAWNNFMFDTPVDLLVTGAGGNPNYYVAAVYLPSGGYSTKASVFPTSTGQHFDSASDSHVFGLNTVDDAGVGNGVFIEGTGSNNQNTPLSQGNATGTWYGVDVILDNA